MRISEGSSDVCSSDLQPFDKLGARLRESGGRTDFGLFSSDMAHAKRPPVMTRYKSHLLRLLDDRGYIHQTTDADGLDALAAKQVVPGYIGFAATAPRDRKRGVWERVWQYWENSGV